MRPAAALIALVAAIAACNPNPSPEPSPEPLAADQTLSFAISQDIGDLDPALVSGPSDVDILRNVFSGLYRYDDSLREVPDIATGAPVVSADGLTYTFRIRANARFANGDRVTSDDFLYSWNRAAAMQGDYASMFGPIAGYAGVASARASTLSGLAKLDDTTFTVTLSTPAPYFVKELGLWPFWLVDRNVVASAGEAQWPTKPETLVGSGPFRMTARTPGVSMDFAPVAGWYGGRTTGRLTHVHVQVVADSGSAVAGYEAGAFSLYGYARQTMNQAAAKRYTGDAKLKADLTLVPLGVTSWVGFSLRGGPFAGVEAGRAGRHAFSTAIDRAALVDAVCGAETACQAATGGLISKGLFGYLGDGQDANAKFDAASAKAEYGAWDPTGAKVTGLAVTYDTNPFNKAVCTNLQQQWKKNLGVDVGCAELDRKTFFDQRAGCAYPLFRQGWAADFDDPAAWFPNLFGRAGTGSSGSCYSNPSFDSSVAGGEYAQAGRLLISDVVVADLLYGVQAYVIHPYVKGAGGNAMYDDSWTEIRILQH